MHKCNNIAICIRRLSSAWCLHHLLLYASKHWNTNCYYLHCFVIPKRLRWNINDDNSTNGKALSNNNCKNNILKIKMKKMKYTFKAKEFFHRLYYSRHKRNLQILLHTLTQQGVRINMRSCVN